MVYFVVDISGSMGGSIERAKVILAKLVQAFPLDKLHVAVFNTGSREVSIARASAAGVEAAFRGLTASGGTEYGAGVVGASKVKPGDGEDALYVFVGDEGQSSGMTFTGAFARVGVKPLAFGLVKLPSQDDNQCVQRTAREMGIPCFALDEKMFDDPYAVPRMLRALVAATPVDKAAHRAVPRKTLVDTILETPLLTRPAWA